MEREKTSISNELFRTIKRFKEINGESKNIFIISVILILSENLLKSFNDVLLGNIIDDTSSAGISLIIKGIVLLGFLQIIRFPVNYFVTYNVNKLSEQCIKRMRKYTYDHISKGSMKWIDSSKTGDLLTRINNDLGTLTSLVSEFFTWQFANLISFIVGVVVCIYVDWKLSLISFIAVPIFAYLQFKSGQPIAELSRRRSEAEGESTSVFVDFLNGLTISKAFGIENAMYNKYKKSVDKSVKYNVKSFAIEFLMLPLQIIMEILPQILMLAVGAYFVISGSMTFGKLFSFIFISVNVTTPISSLSWQVRSIYNLTGISERIFKIWDMELEDEGGNMTDISDNIPVQFDNVRFSYNDKNMILNGTTFTINKNEKVALVGLSGCGKSTVLKLISCFYPKNSGIIKLFGNDIEDWNVKALRKHISYVGQDAFLFPGSIYDNVKMGRRDADDEEIIEAIKMTGLDSLDIYSELGERGVRLSGGQRQRVCIARAMLKNSELIILDEPTSALDTESEYYVTLSLEKLMKNKSCIIVAHRLSAIRNVDRIICIDKGAVVQEGTHDELMNAGGLYKRLYENQLKEEGEVLG